MLSTIFGVVLSPKYGENKGDKENGCPLHILK